MDKDSMTSEQREMVEEFEKLPPREATFSLVLMTMFLALDSKTKLDEEQKMDIAMTLLQFYRVDCMRDNTEWLGRMFRKYPRDHWPDMVAKAEIKMHAETVGLMQRCKLFADMVKEARK